MIPTIAGSTSPAVLTLGVCCVHSAGFWGITDTITRPCHPQSSLISVCEYRQPETAVHDYTYPITSFYFSHESIHCNFLAAAQHLMHFKIDEELFVWFLYPWLNAAPKSSTQIVPS